ncbi:endolytic transglycosylase MltG [Ottowia sp.]|uniref:endolytic transglycosylase MltG n=1 Tax=Ottowia sp. TaxID=1898956 RepID=UPI002B750C52|nr:endolytic transglycosylase MltG [Ottowia sp.]HOB67662.1 endolytic transglycosylase MltG [Ottowia sp.]HPZ56091.1 endolytic transglycosylase MltG [Ottowia sp.]HQD48776.1 endolytic transglycosylase MltG [Ottowia sp.]
MRTLFKWLALLLALALAAGGWAWWWTTQPLPLAAERVEITVPPGASTRTAALKAVEGGVRTQPDLLGWYFRLAGRDQTIKPGDYAVTQGMTPADLLSKLVRGDRIALAVTLVEGWTFKQFRDALLKAEHLRHDTQALTPAEIMKKLGKPGVAAEGRFFPDTYHYFKNASDLDVLRQSMQLMEKRLQAAWDARAPGLPLKSADEALILASVVEKETGQAGDRTHVAGVFVNRLRIGMRLQTDPTVIYGLGDAFEGNLRRSHLQADTPWNTYTRAGLPPTPIAMPGKASLMAAVQPAQTKALYFVARGDGSSHFSESLGEHNRAVNKYQRGGQ